MPANTYDPAKVEVQRKVQRKRPEHPRLRQGQVMRQLVRDWPSEQRSRIRAILLRLRWFSDHGGELEVVKLIDQINEEEQ